MAGQHSIVYPPCLSTLRSNILRRPSASSCASRQRLEKSRVGLISARAIQQELLRLRLLSPLPSQTTIKRWLRQAGLIGAGTEPDTATYYPALPPAAKFITFSCDWVARYLTGGEKVFVFHTIDLQTHALAQTIRADKSTASTCEHLLTACAALGVPDFLQLDNDAAFTGLGRTTRVFGQFVRAALYLGLELIFIPPAEPVRNHVVERVNGLWVSSFWEKDHFASRRELLRKSPKFLTWYETYAPPALDGLTISQARLKQPRRKLSRRQIKHLPQELPLTAGRLHFIRRVNEQGAISILKEPWRVSKSLVGQYVSRDARYASGKTVDLSSALCPSTASADQTVCRCLRGLLLPTLFQAGLDLTMGKSLAVGNRFTRARDHLQ